MQGEEADMRASWPSIVDPFWYSMMCARAADRISEVRAFETGDSWVLSGRITFGNMTLHLFDDYRDQSVEFTLETIDGSSSCRALDALKKRGILASVVANSISGKSKLRGTLSNAAIWSVESDDIQVARLFGTLAALVANESVDEPRSSERVPDLQLRRRETFGVFRGTPDAKYFFADPTIGKSTVVTKQGRLTAWTRLGARTPWLLRFFPIDGVGVESVASLGNPWIRDSVGPRTCFSTLCWREPTVSTVGKPIVGLEQLCASLGNI
jgi:hypothetical protein